MKPDFIEGFLSRSIDLVRIYYRIASNDEYSREFSLFNVISQIVIALFSREYEWYTQIYSLPYVHVCEYDIVRCNILGSFINIEWYEKSNSVQTF